MMREVIAFSVSAVGKGMFRQEHGAYRADDAVSWGNSGVNRPLDIEALLKLLAVRRSCVEGSAT
jgi:hypothetical protein